MQVIRYSNIRKKKKMRQARRIRSASFPSSWAYLQIITVQRWTQK